MGILSDLAATCSSHIGANVTEEQMLSAICKDSALVAALAAGEAPKEAFTKHMTPLISLTSYAANPGKRDAAISSSVDESILEEAVKMVQYMASDFTVDKMKEYLGEHQDVDAQFKEAYARSPEEGKRYLISKVPDIALSAM